MTESAVRLRAWLLQVVSRLVAMLVRAWPRSQVTAP